MHSEIVRKWMHFYESCDNHPYVPELDCFHRLLTGTDPLLQPDRQALQFAARHLFHCSIVEPVQVSSSLLIPGQSMEGQLDVPEFRTTPGLQLPEWLRIFMDATGLFKRWQLRATHALLHLQYAPLGFRQKPGAWYPNSDMCLIASGAETWELYEGTSILDRYSWRDLQGWIAWKAYCFKDEDERRIWARGLDLLSLERILETLTSELIANPATSWSSPDLVSRIEAQCC